MFVVSMTSKPTSKETEHLRTPLCHPKIKNPRNRKVELFIATGARIWNAMMSTLENQLEHLGKGLKNTQKYLHPYMATSLPLATSLTCKTSE